ncbi:MAG TPA: serine--tRNA ligase, partial [Holophagaceae bacterium]|nr:serine--tRNA ligase [Holophagaceae bacterium]
QELDQRRRAALQEAETLKAERNRVSEEVGRLKRAKENADHLIAQQREVGDKLKALEAAEREIEVAFRDFLAGIPNPPHASVPSGRDEHGNVEVKRWGQVPSIAAPKDHVELGTALGILDLDRAAKLSGARFAVLKGLGAKLERALIAFMLDRQTAAGYTEVIPPYLVNAESMYGTGQLPKFEQDLFKIPGELVPEHLHEVGNVRFTYQQVAENKIALEAIVDYKVVDLMIWVFGTNKTTRLKEFIRENVDAGDPSVNWNKEDTYNLIFGRFREIEKQGKRPNPLYLIPTAEVPVTNLYRDEILPAESLPLRHCAFTPCFRSEAGSYGKDTKGIIRQHQFHKVELVSFCAPEQAEAELERLTGNAEAILEALELPYRRVLLCTGDMGFSSQKTYDLEVWLPSQNTYREISSCSWFGDFQARRANLKFRSAEPKAKAQLLHTLNGSGLAVGRTWVAVLENFQQPDGSIQVPKALQPYLGTDVIR